MGYLCQKQNGLGHPFRINPVRAVPVPILREPGSSLIRASAPPNQSEGVWEMVRVKISVPPVCVVTERASAGALSMKALRSTTPSRTSPIIQPPPIMHLGRRDVVERPHDPAAAIVEERENTSFVWLRGLASHKECDPYASVCSGVTVGSTSTKNHA